MSLFNFSNNHAYQKFYKAALISALIFFALVFLLAILHQWLPEIEAITPYLMPVWFQIFMILCSFACMFEIYHRYKHHLLEFIKKFKNQMFTTAVTFMVYVYSNTKINHFINNYTSLDPAFLPNANIALKLIFVLFTILSALFILSYFYFLKQLHAPNPDHSEGILELKLKWLQHRNKEKEKRELEHSLIHLFRVIGIAGLALFIINLLEGVENDKSVINYWAKSIVINTEYFSKSRCQNINKNELVADIGRGYISIYNPRKEPGQQFRVDLCDLTENNKPAG